MSSHRYVHLDVFTDRPFEGNQLAVFLDGRGLSTLQMQAMAGEMNFSESTFILPPESADTDVRMRIFTPGAELPMAGHPTVGSTFALAQEGTIAEGRDTFVFGLGVGPTRVELGWSGDQLDFVWMEQRRPEVLRPATEPGAIIRAAGLDPDAVARTGLPIQEISCGNPFIFVPVESRAAVDAASPDVSAMRGLKSAFGGSHIGVFMFSLEPVEPDVTAYSRMFGAGLGISEDPATGSASGPLGCYLVAHQLVPHGRAGEIVSLQGVAMGRPSRIHIAIGTDERGEITRVRVGGKAVRVGEGTLITG
jgi:trans-2,3-dihydro-3-hydroxyanthranilate isomerase